VLEGRSNGRSLLSAIGAPRLGYGQELAETVTHLEDHHGLLLPEKAPRTLGSVRSIRAIHGRYGRTEGQATCPSQLRDSATATIVSYADWWEAADQERARFVGYLIELDAL
jgi:hypothetical protein